MLACTPLALQFSLSVRSFVRPFIHSFSIYLYDSLFGRSFFLTVKYPMTWHSILYHHLTREFGHFGTHTLTYTRTPTHIAKELANKAMLFTLRAVSFSLLIQFASVTMRKIDQGSISYTPKWTARPQWANLLLNTFYKLCTLFEWPYTFKASQYHHNMHIFTG